MMQSRAQGGDYVIALKDARIGIMGYHGAKTMIYPEDQVDRSQEYYKKYEDPQLALELGIVDEVIAAEDVRSALMKQLAQGKNTKKQKNVRKKQVSLIWCQS